MIRKPPTPAAEQASETPNDPTSRLHLIAKFPNHPRAVGAVGFSPDGRKAISSCWAKTILWDLGGGGPPKVWDRKAGGPPYFVAFEPGGEKALFIDDEAYSLWDLKTGKQLQRWAEEKYVKDSETGELYLEGEMPTRDEKLRRMRRERRKATWTKQTGYVRLSGISGGQHIANPNDRHVNRVRGIALSRDAMKGLSAGGDNLIKYWDMRTGNLLGTWRGHTAPVLAVEFSPDGKKALSGGWDKDVKLWDVKTGRELATYRVHTLGVGRVRFSPDGRVALSASTDHTVKLWDIATGRLLTSWKAHSEPVLAAELSPDGQRLITGGQDGWVRIWDFAAILASVGFGVRPAAAAPRAAAETPVVAAAPSPLAALRPTCKTVGTTMVMTPEGAGKIDCDVVVSGGFDLSRSYCAAAKGKRAALRPDGYRRTGRYHAALTGLSRDEAVRVFIASTAGETIECEPVLNAR